MSLLDKIKGLGRKDGASLDQDTLEQDGRCDEAHARVNGTDVPDLASPGNEGAATLGHGGHAADRRDGLVDHLRGRAFGAGRVLRDAPRRATSELAAGTAGVCR